MTVDGLIESLRAICGAPHVLTDPGLKAGYETDWTGRFCGPATAVVRPADTAEAAAVIATCAAHRCAVVPQGGNTGLVGASVPRDGEVVISTARLNRLDPPEPSTLQLRAGAGVTLAAAQKAAADHGLTVGLDLGARDTATLGGLAACDAGGSQAMRYGTARARIAGIEAVTAKGQIVRSRMSGLLKDNGGYDMAGLIVGCEGTLALITELIWQLEPAPSRRVAALVGIDSLDQAAGLLAQIRPRLHSMEACDFFTREGLALVSRHLKTPPPFETDFAAYLLIECAAEQDPLEQMAEALDPVPPTDVVVAESSAERDRLWRFREAHTEAIAAAGIPHKLDVGVPLPQLGRFTTEVRTMLERDRPGCRPILFGHLGDGNVHVNLLGLRTDDEEADLAVLRLATECGGTISAEHGVGVAKAQWLDLCRTSAEIETMRAVKSALDPGDLLNPGAVLPQV